VCHADQNGKLDAPPENSQLTPSPPTAKPPVPVEEIVLAGQQQVGGGRPLGDVTPWLADRFPDLWRLLLVAPDGSGLQGEAVVRVVGGQVVAPVGLAESARQLRELGVLGVELPFARALYDLVRATGGVGPGWEGMIVTKIDEAQAAGARPQFFFAAPETCIRYAAAGSPGPSPYRLSTREHAGGLSPEEPTGWAELTISSDYRLRWSYHAGGKELAVFEGAPAEHAPSVDAHKARALLAIARQQLGSPYAVPAAPPEPIGPRGLWRLDMLGLGPVYVDESRPAGGMDLGHAVQTLGGTTAPDLRLLEARGGLPPGIRAADIEGTARWRDGVLEAEVAGRLVDYAANWPRRSMTWVWAPDIVHPDWKAKGRMRLDTRHGPTWTLEVGDDGKSWTVVKVLRP
jgi:hypothetical protein